MEGHSNTQPHTARGEFSLGTPTPPAPSHPVLILFSLHKQARIPVWGSQAKRFGTRWCWASTLPTLGGLGRVHGSKGCRDPSVGARVGRLQQGRFTPVRKSCMPAATAGTDFKNMN